MSNKIFTVLLCAVVPVALLAEPVELRSSDGFISVEGEIVGFNGVMLSVETSVGRVSVPAEEVACYGAACVEMMANNDFGLTERNLQGVFGGDSDVALPELRDDLTIGFSDPAQRLLFDTLTATFAVAAETSSRIDLTTPGVLTLENEAGNEVAALTLLDADAAADLTVATTSLNGSLAATYAAPLDWAITPQPSHQMVGLNAFVVVVNPKVQIAAISIEQLAAIYAGEITNWSVLGGPDMAIVPLQLPLNSPLRNELISLVMAPAGKTIASTVLTMAQEASIATSVNQFPGSISVVSVGNAADNVTVPVSGFCSLAVEADDFNILSGDYPLIRPAMVSYVQPVTASLVPELFDFATAKVAQDVLAREGYINQTAIVQDVGRKNVRLGQLLNATLQPAQKTAAAAMFQSLFEAERLSPTLQGGITSGPEGAWNRAMFHSLAHTLKTPPYQGREVLFVGFANSANGDQAAIDTSAQVAATMRSAFTQFAPDVVLNNRLKLSSMGFGSVAPVTCYSGQVSSSTYSRVEIWLR